ncbi:MAG TPA: four helix bundle protein [Candidatus Sulfotelmatobacter sp.]|nr:four helix bundle protein [Candidatus Sulfotelmatobacter sp.]
MRDNRVKYQSDSKDRAYKYAMSVIHMIDKLGSSESNRVIGKQLLRSATSIGANVIEARAASSRRDFTNFLNHALKSANESKFWLGLLQDCGKIERSEIEPLMRETEEIANILAASIMKLKA